MGDHYSHSAPRTKEHSLKNADATAAFYVKNNGSLLQRSPELALQWDYELNAPLTPADVTPHSNRVYYWRCIKFGHSWSASAQHRSKGRGCPICSNRVILTGFNDLTTLKPELAAEWDRSLNESTPEEVGGRL